MSEEDAPWATLGFREEAAVFVSASQNARVLTEGWVEHALFCPNCGAQPMARFAANRPVADFLCVACSEEYELKSQKARLGARVVDGAQGAMGSTMTARLQAQNNPNLLVMRYDARRSRVSDLIVVPKQFFTPEVIERRPPLAPTAQRAGGSAATSCWARRPRPARWRWCARGVALPKAEVLARFRRTLFLREEGAGARGWLIEVLKCVERIGAEVFTLDDVYAFEGRLAALYPANRNVRPKIRQQLQALRDAGLVAFEGRGRYRLGGEG